MQKVRKELGEGKELYCNDALIKMMADGHKVYAAEIQEATYYDTGNKLGYLKAVVDAALEHKTLGKELRAYLKKKLHD